ncbi:permease [Aphanothece sacrum]|nr:permease [Aphanothece sacrum]GBF83717.1 permease [Aphanothece sacrum FPU3]
MPQLSYAYTLFLSNVIASLPFLLFGIMVSSGLLVFVNEHDFLAKLPRNRILGAIVGSSLGMVLPVGQYGNIPVTRRLLLQGVSIPLSISFLIASPVINPFVIWISWQVLGTHPRLLFLRIFSAWLIGIIMGLIFSTYGDKTYESIPRNSGLEMRSTLLSSGNYLLPSQTSQPLHRAGNLIYEYTATTEIPLTWPKRCLLFGESLIQEFLELGSILILGCAIVTAIQVFLPQGQLLDWAQTPVNQMLVMVLFSMVASVGSLWAPYVINPLMSTFLYGSNLTFLLLSSLIDIKNIGLLFIILRPKIAVYLLIFTAQLMGLLCLALNFYFS